MSWNVFRGETGEIYFHVWFSQFIECLLTLLNQTNINILREKSKPRVKKIKPINRYSYSVSLSLPPSSDVVENFRVFISAKYWSKIILNSTAQLRRQYLNRTWNLLFLSFYLKHLVLVLPFQSKCVFQWYDDFSIENFMIVNSLFHVLSDYSLRHSPIGQHAWQHLC